MNQTLIHDRVNQARADTNPTVIGRMKSGWVVIGDHQIVLGYCLLLPDPVVASINDLDHENRKYFLMDMLLVGDALLAVTNATRINYEILGNTEPALHAHIFPRYEHEPKEMRVKPVWFHDWKSAPSFDPEKHKTLMLEIRQKLEELGGLV